MHIVSSFLRERKGGNRLIAALVILIFVHYWRASHSHLEWFGVTAPIVWCGHGPAVSAANRLKAAFTYPTVSGKIPLTIGADGECARHLRSVHQNGRGLAACGVGGGKLGALWATGAAITCVAGAAGAPSSGGRATHLMMAKFGV